MPGVKEIFLLCLIVNLSSAANILYVIPFPAPSHYIMLRPIGLELAKRGHNVTVIAVHKEKNPPPNYHEVISINKDPWTLIGKEKVNVFSTLGLPAEQFYHQMLWPVTHALTETMFQSPTVKEFLATNHTFDLVISELFYQEATYMLAHKYNTPLVLVTTYGNCMKQNMLMRNPLQLSTTVFELLTLRDPTSLFSRLRNVYFTFYEYFWWRYSYLEKQNQMARKYIPNLPEPVPSLYEIQKNTSLVLVNSHFSFDGPLALLPNIVEIGGIHITERTDTMPEDIQNFLDNSKHGVVYVNFGSNVQSSEMAPEKRDAFLNVFRRLKYNVLFKWEDDTLKDVPANVMTKTWMPQSLILAHPNVKVFVAHGGLIGTQEGVYNGVPIIGMPVYTDQYNNLLQVQEKGAGKILEYRDLNEENLYNTLMEVLSNDSFKKNAMELARQFKDRPLSSIDTAMFWIEYVIRSKGAPHMKSPALKLNWFEYHMLDVLAVVIIGMAICVAFVLFVVMGLRRLFQSKQKKADKKKRN